MCGIVGAIAQRYVVEILLEGLKKLEYRGYDSSGIAVIKNNKIDRIRCVGKVKSLEEKILNKTNKLDGSIGIAHTRWATHGIPSENNAHPHLSNTIAIVHNGIIENYKELKENLIDAGYKFTSDTDTEVFGHLINNERKNSNNLLEAVNKSIKKLKGAYGAAIIDSNEPDVIIAARCGSPLVIGLGFGENFIASDQLALLAVTNRFIYLEEGDVAEITKNNINIYNNGKKVVRKIVSSETNKESVDKNGFNHYMQKEIHEQPFAIENTIKNNNSNNEFDISTFGKNAEKIFKDIEYIQIVACGTSYHAGLVSKYWIEKYAKITCQVEIASEYRYRDAVIPKNSLFITLSQSGETADTLEALRISKKHGYKSSLSICNVSTSSLVRESELCFLTKAGAEIGVASTKAFVTQLVAMLIFTCCIAKSKNNLKTDEETQLLKTINSISNNINKVLQKEKEISHLAKYLSKKHSTLFIGRGVCTPIAMEGALKLKEISYIHAEAYAAGELKHGPIALIDENMPIVVIAPTNILIDKLKSNIESVKARNGELFIFTDNISVFGDNLKKSDNCHFIEMPSVDEIISPIIYTVPLQILSYHVAILKGTDVDQPRNLAKSVTVE